jgi:replicative DNA helicase
VTAAPAGAGTRREPEHKVPAPELRCLPDTANGSTDGISVAVAAGRALLGAALLADSAADVAIDVEPAAWPTSDLRAIALAVAQLRCAGRPVDPIALAEQLHRAGAGIGIEVLLQMMNETPSVSLAEHYRGVLTRYRRDRQLVELADQLGRAAYDGEDVSEIVRRIVEVAS